MILRVVYALEKQKVHNEVLLCCMVVANLYFSVSTIRLNSLSLTNHNIDILERNTYKKMLFKYEIILEEPI
jgi:uncharacterized membrane protein